MLSVLQVNYAVSPTMVTTPREGLTSTAWPKQQHDSEDDGDEDAGGCDRGKRKAFFFVGLVVVYISLLVPVIILIARGLDTGYFSLN